MKLAVGILCFFLVLLDVCCFPNWWRGIIERRVAGGQGLEQRNDQDITEATIDNKGVQIPEKLFNKGLATTKSSSCHQARRELKNLCGLRSAIGRMKLASLVTNCHLEASGRPGFEWDPVKKLGDAESDYVHLVVQFLPLMNDVCEKAGYNPFLTQLAADAESTDELKRRIIELQDATERLFAANRESGEFVREYMNASADASKKLAEILKLSADIKDANDDIDFQRESLRQEADTIKSEIQELNRNSLSLFNSMLGRLDGFQSQMRNMADTVGQIHTDSRVTSMFLKEPFEAISKTSVAGFSEGSFLSDGGSLLSPLLPFRKLGLLKLLVLGPLKLSERLHQLESSTILGPFARDIFSSAQLVLVLLSMYIAYVVLTAFTRIVEAVVHFAAMLRPSQPILVRLVRLFKASSQPHARFQRQDIEQKLSERISATISKALSSASVAETFANIVRNEGTDKNINLLLTKTSEIERQIFQVSRDLHLLQSAMLSIHCDDPGKQGPWTPMGISALKSAGTLQARQISAALVTNKGDDNRDIRSRRHVATEFSKVTTSTAEDCSRDEQLEHSNTQSYCAKDLRKSEAGDQNSSHISKKTGIKTPRRELKRRRSSRRKP